MAPKPGKLKILSVVGARPQFMKALMLSRAVSRHNKARRAPRIEEIIVHTGQHYDREMSRVFFDQMQIPSPKYNLGISDNSHAGMTARMLAGIERILLAERPDWVVVFGDTNTTLAGSFAGAKIPLPVVHVEAGLRSFNRRMPEETNRVLTDHLSGLLFCPSDTAVSNLKGEGIRTGVYNVGDVLFDSFKMFKTAALKRSRVLARLGLKPKRFCLATVHRQENTDDERKLRDIFRALDNLAEKNCPVVMPVHPRTRKAMDKLEGLGLRNEFIRLIPPQGYLDILCLEVNARAILTDSGGVQREAYFARVPCVTLRNETEWVETLGTGWNRLAGTQPESIIEAYRNALEFHASRTPDFYGNGRAADSIVETIVRESPFDLAAWRPGKAARHKTDRPDDSPRKTGCAA
ncbi:MAG: UDP-N-acetylglucosamine 2-epimerase (non-hydrolyzing) [Candidatus Aminicenantales bacterium]